MTEKHGRNTPSLASGVVPGLPDRRFRGRLRLGARSELAGLNRRALGFTDVVAQSVAVMAPCAAAATIPLLLGQAGAPLLWSVLTTTVLAGLVAITLGAFASRMVAPGALYTYAAKGLGPGAGVATAAAMTLGYGSLGMFALSQTASFGLRALGVEQPNHWLTCAAVVVLSVCAATILVRGVRISARVGLITEAAAVAVFLGVVGVLVVRTWSQVDVAQIVASPGGWSHYASGVAVAMCGLIGFESAATLSVEAKRPLRTIPRAITSSLAVGAVVLLIATIAQSGGVGVLDAVSALGEGDADLLTSTIGASWVVPIVNLGIAASFFACALASTTALTRMLLSLAREGVVPARLGATHPRFKTPVVGVVATVTTMVIVILVAVVAGASEDTIRGSMASAPAIGFLVAYLVVCAAAPVFLRRTGEWQLRVAAVAWAAAVAVGAILVIFVATTIDGAWAAGIIGALIWLAAAALGYLVLLRVRPDQLHRIGIHETPIRSEVWSGHVDVDALAGNGPPR